MSLDEWTLKMYSILYYLNNSFDYYYTLTTDIDIAMSHVELFDDQR